jgi:hypothetical protein
MKKIMFLMMILGLFGLNQMAFADNNKKILGNWKVEVPDAPYEYMKSVLSITEVNGVLAAKMVFENGQEVEATSIIFAKGILNIVVTIDVYDIPLTGTVDKKDMKGTVETPDGVIEFTATKE